MNERSEVGPAAAELLSASLDGALAEQERAEVDALVARSPAARAERDALAAVKGAVAGLPPVEPPAGFFEAMLERGSPRADAAVVDLASRRRLPRLAGAVAAAVVAAAAWVVVAGSAATPVRPPIEDVEVALVGTAPQSDGVDLVDVAGARVALLRQDGDVDWDELPHGTRGRAGGADTWIDLTSDPGVARVVVARAGRVCTLVSDDLPADALLEVGLDELPPADDGLVARARRAADALLDAFTGN